MPQETVKDLAREFRMAVDEAIEVLVGLGVEVDEGGSTVEEADAEIFRELVSEERRQLREMQRLKKRQKAGDLLHGEIRADMRTEEEEAEARLAADTSAIEIDAQVTLRQFAELVKTDPGRLMVSLAATGREANINTKFSADEAIRMAADMFSVRLKPRVKDAPVEAAAGKKTSRRVRGGSGGGATIPPVVTVMGHVDHGKTTLLDSIRHSNVVAEEAGGITQHIGAYQVNHNGQPITFIDTPGHEAFTSMRARGAKVTDIVVLVVAADDGVMPQTVEAINHAKAAEVPVIVAVNKMDVAGADPDRVKRQLLEHGLIPEDYGGEILTVECSAVAGEGIDEVLDAILLVAEVADLSGNPRLNPVGTVIEAHVDRGRGPVATILVRDGTLVVGDALVVGACYGKVRSMFDCDGRPVKQAGPATPVEVLGLSDVPAVGETIEVAKNERRARKLAEDHQAEPAKAPEGRGAIAPSLEDFFAQVQAGAVEKLNVIVKGDVQGSVEAIVDKLESLSTDEVAVEVMHAGVGPIGKSDIDLARSTGAVAIGFNVSVDPQVRQLADDEGVEIRLYAVIYRLLDDLRAALEGMLEPEYIEDVLGHAEVLQLFRISRVGNVAGCRVVDGVMRQNSNVRVFRDGQPVFDGRLDSLRRVRDNVNEVAEGLECGIHVRGYSGFVAGDVIECYLVTEVARTLDA